MANQVQLELLKKGVKAWNEWRNKNPSIIIHLSGADLSRADLSDADLYGANLSYANLSNSNLHKAYLSSVALDRANLGGANLSEANLCAAGLGNADLSGANMIYTNFEGAQMVGANLSGANLTGANMLFANLLISNLSKSNITGVILYGSTRDDWDIEGIVCDYIFWDYDSAIRTPKDRDFNPGEFEELYKQLPTFDYYFENGFRPIDAVLMSRIVDEINQKNPEFELKLDSFHSRGQAHAKFTVIHNEFKELAERELVSEYESKIHLLEGQNKVYEAFMSQFWQYLENKTDQTINILPGGKMENIKIGDVKGQVAIGNGITQVDHGSQINITRDITNGSSPEEFIGYLNYLLQELKNQKIPNETKSKLKNKLKGAQIQAKKQENKDKVAEKLKSALDVLKNTGALAAESAAFGGMIGKAIEWCEHMVTGL